MRDAALGILGFVVGGIVMTIFASLVIGSAIKAQP
jgi:hypothetical protein